MRFVASLIGLLFFFTGVCFSADEVISFSADVAPILKAKCVACHGPELAEGDYRLDTFARLMTSADKDLPIVVARAAEDSELLKRLITEDEDLRMPAEADRLPASEIDLVRRWIQQGARFDGASRDMPLSELTPVITHPQAPEKYAAAIPVSALAFSTDGQQLLTSGYHEILVWALDGRLLRRIGNQGQRTYSIDLHPNQPMLLASSGTPGELGEVRLFNLESGKFRAVVAQADEVIMDAKFSPDGSQIAIAMPDGAVRIVATDTFQTEGTLLGHSDQVASLTWHQDGIRLGTAGRDKSAKVFDCQKMQSVATFAGHTEAVSQLLFIGDSQALSASDDGSVQLWSIHNGKRQREITRTKLPWLTMLAGFKHSDEPERYLVAGASPVQGFDSRTHNRTNLVDFPQFQTWVNVGAVSPSGKTIALGLQSGEIVVVAPENQSSFLGRP